MWRLLEGIGFCTIPFLGNFSRGRVTSLPLSIDFSYLDIYANELGFFLVSECIYQSTEPSFGGICHLGFAFLIRRISHSVHGYQCVVL